MTRPNHLNALACATFLAGVCFLLPMSARAFCGFYVGGADATLYNDATMVVMMRKGNTTVLSMQNDYSGPAEDFALVVPVPEVLEEENVRTLPASVFERVDRLAAPRLVEYWEQDPCAPMLREGGIRRRARGMFASASAPEPEAAEELGVVVEAEFAVAEYDIVILSAEDSGGLETWLHQENYNIPEGASDTLRPYVEQGTKFFVAKVDPERATFEGNRAILSPLRMHFDSPSFSLPVRLGLLNSHGQQDLIVHILGEQQRYEVANYDNVFIPTNLVVDESVEGNFASFYERLFQSVVDENPRAVVTEYAWRAESCDPCPTQPLSPAELMTLGLDVLGEGEVVEPVQGRSRRRRFFGGSPWTLTRLHFRYDENTLGEDLVFRPASAVVGGRGMPDREGKLQEQRAAEQSSVNNFQGRYAMLHRFEGEVSCENPRRGIWGGPPGTPRPRPGRPAQPRTSAAPSPLRGASADAAEITLASVLPEYREFLPAAARASLGTAPMPQEATAQDDSVSPPAATPAMEEEMPPAPAADVAPDGCGGCSSTGGRSAFGILWLVLAAALMRRRR